MRYEIIPFHDASIHAVESMGRVDVIMKPIVEAFGLDWGGQHKRISKNPILREGISVKEIPSAGGVQKMTTLELTMFLGWLVGISIDRIKDEKIRHLVGLFQREALDAIRAHFFGDRPKDRRPFPNAQERVTLQREVTRLMDKIQITRNPEALRQSAAMLQRTLGQLDMGEADIAALAPKALAHDNVTTPFWAALEALRARGIEPNAHRQPDRFLAVSPAWLKKVCAREHINLCVSSGLLNALRLSPESGFIAAKPVNTRFGRAMHCWVFALQQQLIAAE
ncbi:MAG: phage antirepressor N-terminal domain-containing protein [Asticcacaulis sp.]|uniref:phage antirepressor N-terminal domain-containing protein n=1 Tax=Asticcacaulis sp. TaxID=1872648 RepID=UPI003F7BF470